jgi:hypothetical protein
MQGGSRTLVQRFLRGMGVPRHAQSMTALTVSKVWPGGP